MGVKQFFCLFDGTEISLKELSGSTIAVDCMTELYRAALGMPNINTLTNKKGSPSGHINILLQLALKFQKNDIRQIYVFDSKESPKLKKKEITRRKEKKEQAKIVGDDKRSFQVDEVMIEDIKYMLRLLGVEYTEAPKGYDAEHVCALMNKGNYVDVVLSSDADVFLYGGESLLKYEKKKLVLYTREDLKKTTGLKDNQIVLLGLCLGTDFCDKTKGLGIKTVVKKCLNVELTEEQKKAKTHFETIITWDKPVKYNSNYKELSNWLINKWDFSEDRVKKMLS